MLDGADPPDKIGKAEPDVVLVFKGNKEHRSAMLEHMSDISVYYASYIIEVDGRTEMHMHKRDAPSTTDFFSELDGCFYDTDSLLDGLI